MTYYLHFRIKFRAQALPIRVGLSNYFPYKWEVPFSLPSVYKEILMSSRASKISPEIDFIHLCPREAVDLPRLYLQSNRLIRYNRN